MTLTFSTHLFHLGASSYRIGITYTYRYAVTIVVYASGSCTLNVWQLIFEILNYWIGKAQQN
jgi:hypothetical protein